MTRMMLRVIPLAAALAACSHEITSPPPALSSVAPDLVCNGASVSGAAGVTTVALTGTNFTPMPSKTLEDKRQLLLPRITLSPVAPIPGAPLPAAALEIKDDPADPQTSRVDWQSETSMSFDVAPGDALPPGVFDVTVTNPDKQHASTLAQRLAILPPPVVTAADPMAICDDQEDQTLVVTGASFLAFDGATPTVSLATPTGTKTYSSTVDAADCVAISGTFVETNARLCTKLAFTVPQGDIVVTETTSLELIVTNPAPADCASSTGFTITINPPPRVDSVLPAAVCQGGAQLTINGAHFQPGATVTLDCPNGDVTATTVIVNAMGTQISATAGGPLDVGTCDVIVTNPDTCEDRPLPHQTVTVSTGPIAFFVDPDVVYNGINTRTTIYSTTVARPVQSVTITNATTTTQLAFTTNGLPANRVQATVPIGQPPGVYDLILEDNLHCPTTIPNAITVTATTTVSLLKLVPPFGATSRDTAVTIFRDVNAPGPNDHPFVATPRVFLNPHTPQPGDVAVALQSVAFLDGDRVTGVVPAGTPPNLYDVVLVNPDGTVGILDSGYTETSDAPPEIESATPASIVAATGQQVTLVGTSFTAGNTVTLSCVDALGNTVPSPGVTSGAPICTGANCTQAITINGSTLAAGSVCVVRLTNPDGTYGDYSAIGVTTSSLNLNSPQAGTNLNIGRRGLSAAAGAATGANRFVYAIGGDAGTTASAMSSVEFAAVDLFGTMGAWTVQPPSMISPHTLAGAVSVGRYIYVVGGNDGTGASTKAERALILSPRESPEITDVDLQLASTGLDPGVYHYRVSAVFSSTDPDNPGGESLASDEFTIKVPSIMNQKIVVTLIWRAPVDAFGTTLPNISGYRIYRTAKDGAPGSEVLYGTAPASPRTFPDDGTGTLGSAVPLPLGSTGNWAALADLGTAREGLAAAWARDPSNPSRFYVYALLGRSSAGTANTSYEFLTVDIAANGRQSAGASWTAGTASSAQARWQIGAWTADGTVSGLYSDPFVFIGGGLSAASTSAGKVEAGRVTAGGQLSSFDDTPKDFSSSVAGYGVCAANNQLFTFGGLNATPTNGAQSALLVNPPPDVASNSWNSEGLSMTHGRYLMGSAVQSAFIFLLGGQTDEPSAASTTTERVVW